MARRKKDQMPPKVRKRGKGYTYRYDITVIDEEGKATRKQKETPTYPTPEEAYKAGIIIESQLVQGKYLEEDKTLFNLWAPQMLAYHVKLKGLRLSTMDTYESLLRHPSVYFSGTRIKDITHGRYQDFLFWLKDERKLANSSVTSIHALLTALFKHAVKRGQIGASPCTGAILPKDKEVYENEDDFDEFEVPNFLEKDQLVEVIAAAKQMADIVDNPRDAFSWRQFTRVLIVLAYTGMRVGEIGALEPSKVDTHRLTIKINATLYDKRGLRDYKIGPPKTKESRRIIDISKRVADVIESQLKDLKSFRLLNGARYHNREFIFVMPTAHLPGYPLKPKKINDMLEESLLKAGYPAKLITAHGLRHTYTSLSAEAGVQLDDIRRQLGHASDKMTQRVYLHVTEARKKANVDKLDALLGGLL